MDKHFVSYKAQADAFTRAAAERAAAPLRDHMRGNGPALPVGTPGPRRAADADVLAALMASRL